MGIRVAVIGTGYLGRHHARVFSEIEETELVGVVDIDEGRAGEIAEQCGCQAFINYRDVLPYVDALSIVTPTTTHHEIAMSSLQAGKDLLVEKPFTRTIEEAEGLIAEAESSGRIIQVGHLERFNPVVLYIEDKLKGPRFFEAERLSPFLGRGTDVDITLDLMIHDIDIILSLCRSPIIDIRAVGAKVLTDKIDVAKAWLEMEDGTKALVTASRLSPEKKRILKVFQDSEYIMLDYQSLEIFRHNKDSSGTIRREEIKLDYSEPLKEELKDFARCVMNRRQPRVTARDGLEALRVALEINRKIEETI
ncbi:4-carboxy-2-hydroxymuconate-6-semialdehyde dehydrogenase [bacterium BMS3Bbin07]|nr:4-carboxy-2-hydroxymuconate-6-semialdehyde dehydrogenase [bacterium BMS3Bbin07]HDH02035.1 Gfo/Idh/MocA family oxidoreductase [Nitrospirota bacterium]